jgi:hypothetical protein
METLARLAYQLRTPGAGRYLREEVCAYERFDLGPGEWPKRRGGARFRRFRRALLGDGGEFFDGATRDGDTVKQR